MIERANRALQQLVLPAARAQRRLDGVADVGGSTRRGQAVGLLRWHVQRQEVGAPSPVGIVRLARNHDATADAHQLVGEHRRRHGRSGAARIGTQAKQRLNDIGRAAHRVLQGERAKVR